MKLFQPKLLIVDDDPDVAYSFTRVFREPHFEVLEARSGEQATAIIASHHPDVILMDVRMPGTGGLETLIKLKRQGVDTPVVLMTAYGSARIASDAIQAGAFDCIFKPFDVSRIRQVVSSALEAGLQQRRAASNPGTVQGKGKGEIRRDGQSGVSSESKPTDTLTPVISQKSMLSEIAPLSQLAGDGIFDLLFEEISRRQPLQEELDAFDIIERHLIRRALLHCENNQSRASRFLGITRNTLRKRIRKYGFSAGRDEDDENE